MQFVVLMVVASKLGSFYYGIWGFILMLAGYFSTCNFGIANSLNVLMVQNKDDKEVEANYVASALVCVILLSVAVVVAGLIVPQCHFETFEKYHIGKIFYAICIYAIFDYFNKLFSNIYRVKNRLLELSFYQSINALLFFIVMLLFSGEQLLYALLIAYVSAQILSFIVFVTRGGVPFRGKPSLNGMLSVIKKGFYLFIYNSCFYLILVTTSSIISYNYSVSEYGLYTFSYNLGHSILLILEAFTFIVFPKLLDKFYSGNNDDVKQTIQLVRINYVVLSHGLFYLAFLFFPLFVMVLPQFKEALISINLTGLAIILTVNSFGFNTFLIARNKEKLIAIISATSLLVNVLVGFLIVKLHAAYYMVVLCLMISYFVFAVLCSMFANIELKEKTDYWKLLSDVFPLSLLIPFGFSFVIAMEELYYLSFLPFVLYLLLNISSIKEIVRTFNVIRLNSNFINIK